MLLSTLKESEKRYLKSVTHLTLHNCNNFFSRTDYTTIPNLVHLDIYSGEKTDMPYYLRCKTTQMIYLNIHGLNRNLRFLRIAGDVNFQIPGKDLGKKLSTGIHGP